MPGEPAALAPTAFLGYDWDFSSSTAFSFLKLAADGSVLEVAEKRRISDQFGTGVYGFASKAQFVRWARHTLQHGPRVNNEIYMSSVFVNMLAARERVLAHHVPIIGVGTAEMAAAHSRQVGVKLRLCFDFDNTLVTYPAVPGDYSTVLPIAPMVDLARQAKEHGHTIIIYTARRMATHGNNAAAALADVGRITFATIDKFGIPCDEIVFGKPVADIYIDDRAINPYMQSVRAFGIPFGPPVKQPDVANKLPSNVRGVSVRLSGLRVAKAGPLRLLRGQVHFAQQLQAQAALRPLLALFPGFLGHAVHEAGASAGGAGAAAPSVSVGGSGTLPGEEGAGRLCELYLEVVKAVPLTTMLSHRLLEAYHLDLLLGALDRLHAAAPDPAGDAAAAAGTAAGAAAVAAPDRAALAADYLGAMHERFSAFDAYSALDDAAAVLAEVSRRVEAYAGSAALGPVPLVHGNCLLSNVLLESSNALKLLSARGSQLGDAVALGGDPLLDLARVCQSLLGFDELTLGVRRTPDAYRAEIVAAFVGQLRVRGAEVPEHVLTLALFSMAVAVAAPELEDGGRRDGLWALVRGLALPSAADAPRAALAALFARR